MDWEYDLHLHTTYSDGVNSLDDICGYAKTKGLKFFSITDHNTISGTLNLEKKNQRPKSLLYGTEFRLPGLPDLLMYFPAMTILEAECLEHELAELNRLDQEITIAVANDFIDGNIIKLWRESPFFNETGNYWMGTLQLAQLISKDFHPNQDTISAIRAKKSSLFRAESRLGAAEDLLHRATIEWVSGIAEKYHGVIALAHPFREVARHYHEQKKMDFDSFSERLTSLFTKMEKWRIFIAELILMYSECWWNEKFLFPLEKANEHLFSLCKDCGVQITTGSDSHCLKSEEQLLRSVFTQRMIRQFTPEWLK